MPFFFSLPQKMQSYGSIWWKQIRFLLTNSKPSAKPEWLNVICELFEMTVSSIVWTAVMWSRNSLARVNKTSSLLFFSSLSNTYFKHAQVLCKKLSKEGLICDFSLLLTPSMILWASLTRTPPAAWVPLACGLCQGPVCTNGPYWPR